MGSQYLYRRIPELPASPINFSASGDNIVLAIVPGSRITVYGIWMVAAEATTLTLKDGVNNDISGPITVAANQEVQLPLRGEPWVTTAIDNPFIINSTAAVQVGGIVSYQTTLGPPTVGYTAIILYDSNLVRWGITILPSTNLDSELTPAGPAGALEVDPVVFQSPNGTLYQLTILTTGNLVTTVVGAAVAPYVSIQLNNHTLSVSNAGNLITS